MLLHIKSPDHFFSVTSTRCAFFSFTKHVLASVLIILVAYQPSYPTLDFHRTDGLLITLNPHSLFWKRGKRRQKRCRLLSFIKMMLMLSVLPTTAVCDIHRQWGPERWVPSEERKKALHDCVKMKNSHLLATMMSLRFDANRQKESCERSLFFFFRSILSVENRRIFLSLVLFILRTACVSLVFLMFCRSSSTTCVFCLFSCLFFFQKDIPLSTVYL